MKNIFLAVLTLTVALGCNREEKKVITEKKTINVNGEVWAEKAISQTHILMPDGWSEEDWNKENKIENEKIFKTIMEAVYADKLKAFDPLTDTPLSANEIRNRFKTEISSKDISRIDMHEKWFFDEKTYSLNKQVESLTFLKSKLTESGDFMGHIALFKVKLN